MGPVKANRLVVAAFVAATLGALIAAFAPTYSSCTSTSSGGEVCGHATSFAVNGTWVLVVVSVPILVTLIPVLVRRRSARIVSTVLLWIGCFVGMWSVGMFFVPAAILMTIAAAQPSPAPVPPMPPVPAA
jgi:hypothetical protein